MRALPGVSDIFVPLSEGRDGPSRGLCSCGRPSDPEFLARLGPGDTVHSDWSAKSLLMSPRDHSPAVPPPSSKECRRCKEALLLRGGILVDKYCFGHCVVSRKKKVLKVDLDKGVLEIWPTGEKWFRKKVASIVDLSSLTGVVFGAYTYTFKKQREKNCPPCWSTFSLIGTHRTYDFSSRLPEVVESAVRGLQQIIWDMTRVPATLQPDLSALSVKRDDGGHVFRPMDLGFFLWMRMRFRLQEAAGEQNIGSDFMLWMVFMRCAFRSTSEIQKQRFIHMAHKLHQPPWQLPVEDQWANQTLAKVQFQRDRVVAMVSDSYDCKIHMFLPRAPHAVVDPLY